MHVQGTAPLGCLTQTVAAMEERLTIQEDRGRRMEVALAQLHAERQQEQQAQAATARQQVAAVDAAAAVQPVAQQEAAAPAAGLA